MRKGRIKRNMGTIFMMIVSFGLCIFFKISPKDIVNYTDIMNGVLSFSSIATALLFACLSLIPTLPNSKLVNMLQELGTDIKLLDRLLLTTTLFFMLSIVCIVGLLFNSNSVNALSMLLIALWCSLIVGGIVEVFSVIRIMFKVVEKLSDNRK